MLSLLVILGLLLYAQTLSSPFILDDHQNILENPNIRWTGFSWSGIKKAGLDSPASRRPVANLSFALNYYFHRYNIVGYHIVNIFIHITTSILLFFLVKTTLNLPLLSSRYDLSEWIPFFTALIWLVHPLQTQSVTYIVQRMNSLTAMFYILSLLFYAKGRLAEGKKKKWALFSGCTLAGILALGSKEIAATLPFFLFLYEWYFFQDLGRTWLKRHLPYLAGLLIFFAVIAVIYFKGHPLDYIRSTYKTQEFTITERALTQFRVIVYYISLIFYPHPSRLNLDYDFPLSHSILDPISTLLSLATVLALIALALYLARKEPLVSFCIFWFLGNLAIESSVLGLEIIFEHRTYLPSMFLILMAVTLAFRYIRPTWMALAVICIATTICGVWTDERNKVWASEVSLWKDCVDKSPGKLRPHNNLGLAFYNRGNFTEAASHLQKALQIEPGNPLALNNLGLVSAAQGRSDEAVSLYTQALRSDPDYITARRNLANELRRQGRLDEAISHYRKVLTIEPDSAVMHNNLGVALAMQGKIEEASAHFLRALEIDPLRADSRQNLEKARALRSDTNY